MGILSRFFRRQSPRGESPRQSSALPASAVPESAVPDSTETRYKIKITAEDGQTFYWHKRGQLHTVESDVAEIFVANFKPELFQVRPDGSLHPPIPGETLPIRKVTKERAGRSPGSFGQ